MNRKIITWEIIACLAALVVILMPMFFGKIHCDATYYICMVERIADGMKPYHQLSTGYTPLWMYIALAFKTLFHVANGSYVPYLILHYLFLIGVAICIYQLAKEWKASQPVAFIGAWLMFMGSQTIYGNYVLLEIPSIFFGMLSLWLVVKFCDQYVGHLLWIGAFASCAFLVKQYGLGFLVLDIMAVLYYYHRRWQGVMLLLLGYSVPLLLTMAYFGQPFVTHCLMTGYGTSTAVDAGWDTSLVHKVGQVLFFVGYFALLICPFAWIGLFHFKKAHQHDRLFPMLLAYAGILGFSLQFYFADYIHYMLFMLPFGALLVTIMLSLPTENSKGWQWCKRIAVIYMAVASLGYAISYSNIYELLVRKDTRLHQLETTQQIQQYIHAGDTVWVSHYELFYLYLTGEILPPNLSTLAYSFGPLGLNEEQAFTQAKAAEWVVAINPKDPYETFLTDSIDGFLQSHEVIRLKDNTILLYKIK